MQATPDPASIAAVDAAIAGRRTRKVFADPSAPPALPDGFLDALEPALAVAGMAPFHHACHASHRGGAGAAAGAADAGGASDAGGAIEPWRAHLLDAAACRALIGRIEAEAARAEAPIWRDAPGSKIPRMLAAAGALVLLCWLPDPPPGGAEAAAAEGRGGAAGQDADGVAGGARREAEWARRNREHLAAAAAYGQSLLVAATARGLASYWSSGGVLAEARALAICGVPAGQALLGALFFFPEPAPGDEVVTGKLRPQRRPAEAWLRRVAAADLS
ncbi:MAG: hypothetical protein H6648_11575 [Caldilineae bacterium]|nr:hypothetical protein [Caldilineae bacterium]